MSAQFVRSVYRPSRARFRTAVQLLILILLAPLLASAEEPLTGDQIIERYVDRLAVDTELAYIEMKVVGVNEKAETNRFLAAFRRNEDGSEGYLVRLVRPEDVEGVSVLSQKAPDGLVRQFYYLPALGEAREIKGDGRSGAFLGSDFTFEDLLREIPAFRRYERLEDFETPSGEVCYRIRAWEEREDVARAYGYRDLIITKDSLHLIQTDYYSEDGEKIKTLVAYEYEDKASKRTRTRPARAIMTTEGAGTWTSFKVIVSRIGEPLPSDLFSIEGVRNLTPEQVNGLIFQLGMSVVGSNDD